MQASDMSYAVADLPRERREEVDRRRPGLKALWYSLWRPRRRHVRRSDEATLIDIYPARYRALLFGVLGLSCADAWLTVHLLSHGASEVNPVMDLLIGLDLGLFVFVKTLVTGLCAGMLMVYADFRLFGLRGERHLNLILLSYMVLIGWELMLLAQIAAR